MADASMNSGQDARRNDRPAEIWEKYVREMSPFYFNMFSEYLEAAAS